MKKMRLGVCAFILSLVNFESHAVCGVDLTDTRNWCAGLGGSLYVVKCHPDDPVVGSRCVAPPETSPPNGCDGATTPVLTSCVGDTPTPPAITKKKPNYQSKACGSVINVDDQSLLETIKVSGTNYHLVYSSDKVKGNRSLYKIDIPLTSGSFVNPGYINGIKLNIYIAGKNIDLNFTNPDSSMLHEFFWDGKDANGDPIDGSNIAEIEISADYDSVNKNLVSGVYLFELPTEAYVPKVVPFGYTAVLSPVPYKNAVTLGNIFGQQKDIGGWRLDVHHIYDPVRKIVYLGDGSSVHAEAKEVTGGKKWIISSDRVSLFVFDSSNKHIETRDAVTNILKYSFNYNVDNSLSQISDVHGNTTTIQYVSGKPVSITSPDGVETLLETDLNGYISKVSNALSQFYSMTYTSDGLMLTFQKPDGMTSTMTYTPDGLLLSDSNTLGNLVSIVKSVDAGTTTLLQSSAENREISYEVKVVGDIYTRKATFPNYRVGTYTENLASKSMDFDHGDGRYGSQTFVDDLRFGNSFKIPYSLSNNEGPLNQYFTYNESFTLADPEDPFSFSELVMSWTSGIKNYERTYTSATRTIVDQSPGGVLSTTILNTKGQASSYQHANFAPLTFSHDVRGRLTTTSQGSGKVTTLTYGGLHGELTNIQNALGQNTSFTHDNLGRVITQTLPDSRVISYGYDLNGNLARITPPGRAEHEHQFNGNGAITSYIPPLITGVSNVATSYSYDNDRNLIQVARPDGQTIVMDYDVVTGNLNSITTPDGIRIFSHFYSSGLYLNSTSEDGIGRSFYKTGSIISLDSVQYESINSSVNNTFSGNAPRSSETLSVQLYYEDIPFTYNLDDQLTSAGAEVITRNLTNGLMEQVELENIQENYGYSTSYGELSSFNANYTSSNLFSYSVVRDVLGRIKERNVSYGLGPSDFFEYFYDSAGRLESVKKNTLTISSYVYDQNSNRIGQTLGSVSQSATYDGQDRLLTFGSKSFNYNHNGDLVSMNDSFGTTNYTYDVLGNLKTVASPTKTINYKVDAFNRRIVKLHGTTVINIYVWDSSDRLIAVLDDTGTLISRFVYGSRYHSPDYIIQGADKFKIISDHLGSPVLVVNSQTGTIVQEVKYDEFGNILSDSNPGFTPFGFAGCLYDQDTKLCRFGARDYDSSIGRWLSKDPILFAGGDTNLYGYVMQDPINLIDTNGMSPEDVARMQQVFNQSVARMDQMGVRRPGEGYLNGALNNIGSTLGCGYWGCGQQANYVVEQLTNSGIGKKFDDYWTFSVVNVTPFHQRAEARSSNPKDPVVSLDPWTNKFSTQSCK